MSDNDEFKMKVKTISDNMVSEYFDKLGLDANKVNERLFGEIDKNMWGKIDMPDNSPIVGPYVPGWYGTLDQFKKEVKTLVVEHNQAVPEIVELHQELLKLQNRYDEAFQKYIALSQQMRAVLIPQNTIDEEILSQQIVELTEAKEAWDKAGVELGKLRDRINSLELPLNTLLYYLFGQPMPSPFSTPMDKIKGNVKSPFSSF